MKSVAELREDALKQKQIKERKPGVETVEQLEKIYAVIEDVHLYAVEQGKENAFCITQLDLTAAAQEELARLGYTVEELPVSRSMDADEQDRFKISWTY